jgi:hypothetical protein
MIALQRNLRGQPSCHGSPDRTVRLGPEIVDDRDGQAIHCEKLLTAGGFCVAVKPNQPFRPPKDPSPAVLLPAADILAPCRLLLFLSSMTNSLFVGR